MLPIDNRNPKLSAKCRTVFSDFSKKQIDEKEFNKRLAMISNEFCLNDLKKRDMPKTPLSLEIYRKMDLKDKRLFLQNNSTFFIEGEIVDYLNQVERINSINQNNLKWLNEKVAIFEQEKQYDQLSLVKNIIRTYSNIHHEPVDWIE